MNKDCNKIYQLYSEVTFSTAPRFKEGDLVIVAHPNEWNAEYKNNIFEIPSQTGFPYRVSQTEYIVRNKTVNANFWDYELEPFNHNIKPEDRETATDLLDI